MKETERESFTLRNLLKLSVGSQVQNLQHSLEIQQKLKLQS